MQDYGFREKWSSASVCFLILAPKQLQVFFPNSPLPARLLSRSFITTSLQLFHSFLLIRMNFLWGGSRHKQHPCISAVALSLLVLHYTSYRPSPALSPLPLHSLVFHMPSKALCSVPFLPLPQVLFDTPGTLMGQSETLSLRISLWLIFISPSSLSLSLRFITSAAYSSRCFVLGFTLCNC